MWNITSSSGPNRDAALAQYRHRAGIYDLELVLFEPIRQLVINSLALLPGDTVLDVGCGTGLSFERLQQDIGPGGRIIGIEQCPEMLGLAQKRVEQQGWTNVTLIGESVEAADISVTADAALFHFTHDILRSAPAVANVVRHLKPGGRVAAAGIQWASAWAWPVNWLVLPIALHSISSLEGLEKPWNLLEPLLQEPEVQTLGAGSIYIVSGELAPPKHVVHVLHS
ncbi:MAG: class I SAM-dependent methyltransferase [Pseudomonadota bacterium]